MSVPISQFSPTPYSQVNISLFSISTWSLTIYVPFLIPFLHRTLAPTRKEESRAPGSVHWNIYHSVINRPKSQENLEVPPGKEK